jgi:hypothetical protein
VGPRKRSGANPSSIAGRRKNRFIFATMSTKSRQTTYGGRIIGAKIRAEAAREAAPKAIREADRAEAEAWPIQPAQPSPTIAQCLTGGYGWLGVECTPA